MYFNNTYTNKNFTRKGYFNNRISENKHFFFKIFGLFWFKSLLNKVQQKLKCYLKLQPDNSDTKYYPGCCNVQSKCANAFASHVSM